MKRLIFLLLCAAMFLTCAGCAVQETGEEVKDGCYYLVGDLEEPIKPNLWLYTDNRTFYMSAGPLFSYAEKGEYTIEGSKLIATSQTTVFVFEIKDENTLILVDNGDNDYFKLPVNGEFRYSEDAE